MNSFREYGINYIDRLANALKLLSIDDVEILESLLSRIYKQGNNLFIIGNGGSAGNSIHLANDFIYGVTKRFGAGIRAHALAANQSIVTCLANDVGYEDIFLAQLGVLAKEGDVLLALSGSGNSGNICKALRYCRDNNIDSVAIVAFDGGDAKRLAKYSIHVPVRDMQIAEDLQLVIGHMIMQWMYREGHGE